MSYYLQEGSMLKDWDKIRTAAKEEGDLLAIEFVWAFDFDPWDEFGRQSLRTEGRYDGARRGMADAEADETIEDKNELKELALKTFEKWWKDQESSFTRQYGVWPLEDVNPDIDEIKRVYRTGFVEAYQKAGEKVRRGENASFSETAKELPNLSPAGTPIEDDLEPDEPEPEIQTSGGSAAFFDPKYSSFAAGIQDVAIQRGKDMASGYYPYAVIEDVGELRTFANDDCSHWWSTLDGNDVFERYLPGVRRIYVPAFVKSYMESVDSKSVNPGRWKNTQASGHADSVVKVRNQNQLTDGVTYTVDFYDPDRMTRAVSFGITVKNDGAVEIEEA
jgi:hypothetical protein